MDAPNTVTNYQPVVTSRLAHQLVAVVPNLYTCASKTIEGLGTKVATGADGMACVKYGK